MPASIRIKPLTGNPLTLQATLEDTQCASDILDSQLGLLPSNHFSGERRAHIIVCGSALLNHYADSDYYQNTYYKGIKEAYEAAQHADPKAGQDVVSAYVKSQVSHEDFHHVLTELAFLQLRLEKEHDHGIF